MDFLGWAENNLPPTLHFTAPNLPSPQDSADLEREKTRNEITRAFEEERTERLRMDEELREEHLRHLAEMSHLDLDLLAVGWEVRRGIKALRATRSSVSNW